MKLVEPWLQSIIKDNEFVVLRDKRTKKALHVSYTEDGLKWALDPRTSKSLYFKDAYLSHGRVGGEGWNGLFRKERDPNTIVEKFIPMNHVRTRKDGIEYVDTVNQSLEFKAVDRALRMLTKSQTRLLDNFSDN